MITHLKRLALLAVSLACCAASHAFDTPAGGGYTKGYLIGEYYANTDLSGEPKFKRYDLRIDHDWRDKLPVGGSLAPKYRDFPLDNFSVRWTGEIAPRFSETYTIKALADEGVRVWIKQSGVTDWGMPIIDNWTSHPASAVEDAGTYPFNAGQLYDIKVEYRELTGNARIHLKWSSLSTPEEVIDSVAQAGLNHHTYTPVLFANGLYYPNINKIDPIAKDAPLTFDDKGWPNTDFSITANGNENTIPGTYRLEFTGKARVEVNGATFALTGNNTLPLGTGYSTLTKKTKADLTFAGPAKMTVKFSSTEWEDASGIKRPGLRDYYMMKPTAYNSTKYCEPGQMMADDTMEAFKHFRVLRWQTLGLCDKEILTWQDRTRPDAAGIATRQDANGDKGSTNLEAIIMMANESGRDLQLCFPTLCDLVFFKKVAYLCKYGSDGNEPYTTYTENPIYPPLNPGIKIYLEHGNEQGWSGIQGDRPVWSDYMTTTEGQALNFDDAYPNGNDYRWHALRTARISLAFRDVFTDEMMHRVRPVLFGQYSQPWQTQMCQYLDSFFNRGDSPLTVNQILWGAGPAVYYTCTNKYGTFATEPLADWQFENYSVTPGTAALRPTGGAWTFAGHAGVIAPQIARRDAITSFNLTGLTPSNPLTVNTRVGFTFTVGAKDIYVYDLGRASLPGNGLPADKAPLHQFAIYQPGVKDPLINARNEFGVTGGTGAMVYRPLLWANWITENARTLAPLRLLAGQTYTLVSNELAGVPGETFHASPVPVTTDPAITITAAVMTTDNGVTYTSVVPGSYVYGPINFRFADAPVTTSAGVVGFPPDVTGTPQPRELALGTKAAFIAGTGSMEQTVVVPQDDQYALYFTSAQSQVLSNPITITMNGVEVWSNDVPSADRKPAPGFYPYNTNVKAFTAGQSVTIRIRGMSSNPDAVCFLDNIRLVSLKNFYGDDNASTFPFSGEATGSDYGTFLKTVRSSTSQAAVWGLTPLTYEGGWAFGGDWEIGDMLMWNYAKEKDSRTVAADNNTFNLWRDFGGTVFQHYYKCFENEQVATLETLPIVQAIIARNRTITEATQGLAPGQALPYGNTFHHRGEPTIGPGRFNSFDLGGVNNDPTIAPTAWLAWQLYAPVSATYYFTLETTPGGTMRVSIDGDSNQIPVGPSGQRYEFSRFLTKGQHSIKVLGVTGSFILQSLRYDSFADLPPPTANAGPDQSVNDSPGVVTLDGTGSTGQGLVYSWSQVSGPSVALAGSATAKPTFSAATPGTYVFRLQVTSPKGVSQDTVQVTITPGDVPAAVFADHDRTVAAGSTVTLAGQAFDNDNDAIVYAWTQTSGPAVTLAGAATATASFVPSATGTYTFQLAATSNGITKVDTVTVTVVAPAVTRYWGGGSATPTASVNTTSVDMTGFAGNWNATTTNWNADPAAVTGWQAWTPGAIASFKSSKTTSGPSVVIKVDADASVGGFYVETPAGSTNQNFHLVGAASSGNRTLTLAPNAPVTFVSPSSSNSLQIQRAGYSTGQGAVLLAGTGGFTLNGLGTAGDPATTAVFAVNSASPLSGNVTVNSGTLRVSDSNSQGSLLAVPTFSLVSNQAVMQMTANATANVLGNSAVVRLGNSQFSLYSSGAAVAASETLGQIALEGTGTLSMDTSPFGTSTAQSSLVLTGGFSRGRNGRGVLAAYNGVSTDGGLATATGIAINGHGFPASRAVLPYAFVQGRYRNVATGLDEGGANTTRFMATDAAGNLRGANSVAGLADLSAWSTTYNATSDLHFDINSTPYFAGFLGGDTVVRTLALGSATSSANATLSMGGNQLKADAIVVASPTGLNLDIGKEAGDGTLTANGSELYIIHHRSNVTQSSQLTIDSAITGAIDVVFAGTTGQIVLAGSNVHTGQTYINTALLRLATSGTMSKTSAINLSAGSQFDVSSASWTLGGAVSQTLRGGGHNPGTGNIKAGARNVNVAAGSFLAPGYPGSNTVLRLDFSTGKLFLLSGSTLALDLGAPDDSDALEFVGPAGDELATGVSPILALTLGAGFDYAKSYRIIRNVTTDGFSFGDITGYDRSQYIAYVNRLGNDYVLSFAARPKALPFITTSSLPDATIASAYPATLAATNIDGAATWSLVGGSLPAGLTLTSAGAFSGQPASGTAGVYSPTFRVVDADNESNTRTLSLRVATNGTAPVIVSQPASANVNEGSGVTLSVVATSNAGALSYQWKRGSTNVGGNSPTLVLNNVAAADAGSYTVVVTNSVGFVTSAPADLSVVGVSPSLASFYTALSSSFVGTSPALSLPWTSTGVLDVNLIYGGWTAGAGIYRKAGDNALVWGQREPDTEAASTLAQAIADNEYWSTTLQARNGALDLRGADITFKVRRIGFHAPRRYAVFTSVGGFADGNQVGESIRITATTEQSFSIPIPDIPVYANLTGPVEIRIVGYAGQYDDTHTTSLTGFTVSLLGSPDVTDSLVARYNFENASVLGSDTSGSSPAKPGTVYGTGVSRASTGVKVGGGATQWTGDTSTRIEVPNNTALDAQSKLSVCVWINPDATGVDGASRGIVSKRTGIGANMSYSLFLSTGGKLYVDINGTNRFNTTNAITPNTWTHLALVYDGTLVTQTDRVKLYVNGQLLMTRSNSLSSLPNQLSPLNIGTLNSGFTQGAFSGLLDDVRVYGGKALTAAEIATIMAATR